VSGWSELASGYGRSGKGEAVVLRPASSRRFKRYLSSSLVAATETAAVFLEGVLLKRGWCWICDSGLGLGFCLDLGILAEADADAEEEDEDAGRFLLDPPRVSAIFNSPLRGTAEKFSKIVSIKTSLVEGSLKKKTKKKKRK
jgi:hypothetical protein